MPIVPAVRRSVLLVAASLLAFGTSARADDDGWISLSNDLKVWKEPRGEWLLAKSVRIDPKKKNRLKAEKGEFEPGKGVMVNGQNDSGRTHDIYTKQNWGDLEVSLEFMIPQHSNSGAKLEGQYEIQIYDSASVKEPTGADCGGIYPRAEFKPNYHHIDHGIAPKSNAAKKPGEWQKLEIVFHAPRFDAAGKKTSSAQFEKVVLNGVVIHDHVEVTAPTGAAWHDAEHPTGPLQLQADHGPVAFRNVRVRPLKK